MRLMAAPAPRRLRSSVRFRRLPAVAAACGAAALLGAPVAGAALPSKMAALGDSITRGYASSGAPGSGDNFSASWATGTASAVNSHYSRLLALNPAISGNAANYATNGSKMAGTLTQADSAVALGAGYVTIMSGTNDICTTTVAQMTSTVTFKSQLTSTLTRLTTNLPNAAILVTSIPNWYGVWQSFQSDPSALSAWTTYNNRCPDLLGVGATQADRDAVRQRIIDLNAAEAEACAAFSGCTYDGGAVYNLSFARTDLSYDYFHPSITGQALLAQATWVAGAFYGAPVNTGAPAVAGAAQEGQSLAVSTGAWSGAPASFSYQWSRCNAAGAGCVAIGGATGAGYQAVAGDVGSTLRAAVTATNSSGSATATSDATGVVAAAIPAGFTAVVTSPGCTTCAVLTRPNGFWARIDGGADDRDTAYALLDFGGPGGLAGRTFTRDMIGLAQGQRPTKNLTVFQVRDAADQVVYELYLDPNRRLRLYSPAGGLRSNTLNSSTGVVVPNDGSSTVRVEVSAEAGKSVTVRVDGVTRISLNLKNATSGNQRYLRAGIDHYDSTGTTDTITTLHTDVAVTQIDWPDVPGAPTSTDPPAISGAAQDGQTLTASTGGWSGAPDSLDYQWIRCDSEGAGCDAIGGATGTDYRVIAGDVGSTLLVAVTATNSSGSATATSDATDVVAAAVPAGFTAVVTGPGCTSCAVLTRPNGFWARIDGGADDRDTAYALLDFGGPGGLAGRTFTRDMIGLAQGQRPTKNLTVFQVRDAADQVVYELYLDPNRRLRLYSPAGGLRSNTLNTSTGVVVPNDGSSTVRAEVSAEAGNSVIVLVDGVTEISLSLTNATSGNQRYLRAGIDHYDSTGTTDTITTLHTDVAVSQTGWPGAP